MKKISRLLLPLFLISILIFTGCKKDDNSTPSGSSTVPSLITTGTWHVSYYHEGTVDHTGNFTDYSFTFNSNGTMTGTHSGVVTNGTWSNDDSKNEFHMSMGNSSPLSDMNKGWLVILKTTTEFDLKDDNSMHPEELHFTKD